MLLGISPELIIYFFWGVVFRHIQIFVGGDRSLYFETYSFCCLGVGQSGKNR